ncbi:NAD(P)/FAD-dependent oxidoreductase [Devosia neptuniae]|jgi:protoporphyrinogen oxidase|uniref:NAD(P)/FAD-dependent oxidoreductase n=1 Tax=Devosia TaxID=46913 RepID=UPI0022AF3A31|nr:NAD(P)/FAD-dependent oxidoreductase [Devosia neptuniae]MCZ4345942.1 NAD(P)/FAD-dependent oxidoreductase [Devosia neptuniae]|tara:strand:- start:48824 stop:50308 length:1485 start_codon:yes stop_codon:yes gene_type:complete
MNVETLIIGAGPAGLTTAYELTKAGHSVAIVERDPVYVGGISRTVNYKGYRFDIGGHRFFSKSAEVEAWWTEIMGDEMLQRPRSSRIYYNGKLFDYPLRAGDALAKLGPVEALRCVISYGWAQIRPHRNVVSFEQWVVNNFGRRLFEIFFKTYTEKVWGMDCGDISADWAAQRIKGLNLYQAIIQSFGLGKKPSGSDGVIKTLINSFRYPRLGPGQMWERARDKIVDQGGTMMMGSTITAISQHAETGKWIAIVTDAQGKENKITADHVVSTAAVNELVRMLGADADPAVAAAAKGLRYRDFLIIGLITRGKESFDDNWIYIHDPSVRVGRIQNFKSWSPDMVPDPNTACYGMEYFCNAGDDTWDMSDADLIARAKQEIGQLGLAAPQDIIDGSVVRQPKAYPVYDDTYKINVDTITEGLEEQFTNLHLAGRNGMHKYNNQDHAMMTGILTAKNIIAGSSVHDVWGVNEDAEYHEGGSAGDDKIEERLVPRRIA